LRIGVVASIDPRLGNRRSALKRASAAEIKTDGDNVNLPPEPVAILKLVTG